MITNRNQSVNPDEASGHPHIRYAVNRREGVCIDCGRSLAPGQARIWSRGKKRPWGIACRVKSQCAGEVMTRAGFKPACEVTMPASLRATLPASDLHANESIDHFFDEDGAPIVGQGFFEPADDQDPLGLGEEYANA